MSIRPAALLLMALVLSLCPAAHGAGKKEDKATVTFHLQTDETDDPKMIFPQLTNGKTLYFRRVPEVNLKDIVSYTPFPTDAAGDDFGIIFKLKGHAATRLAAITNANQGRWLIAQVNGRIVDGVLIDKQVDDGQLVIWKAITLADVAILDKVLPRTGEEGKKKK